MAKPIHDAKRQIIGSAAFCGRPSFLFLTVVPFGPEQAVYRRVDDASVAVVRLTERTLVRQPALFHYSARVRIIRIVPRFDPVCADPVEQKRYYRRVRLAGNAETPPPAPDAVTDVYGFRLFFIINNADRTDRLAYLLQDYRPLVKIRLGVPAHPFAYDAFGYGYVFVRAPAQELRDLFVRGPVSVSRRRVGQTERP